MNIDAWMQAYEQNVYALFGGRIVFLGLQGSRSRGEATEASDIDPVLILDEVSPADLLAYRDMLDTMPERELICGFICGRRELENWEKSDLFQFCRDTLPVCGSLDFVQQFITDEDVRRAVRIGACNLYHAAVHNLLHGRHEAALAGLYKSAAFVVQVLHFARTGEYIHRRDALIGCVPEAEREILATADALKSGESAGTLEELSGRLIGWCSGAIAQYGE